MQSDENKPVRMAFSVTSARVQHYDDIIEYMTNVEIDRFRQQYGFNPSLDQIQFLKKELVRYAVIRHDIETAQKIRISKNRILNEESNICPRAEQLI